MIDVFDAAGQHVPIAKQLGTGGEGAVYEVPSYGPDFVAKIYHHQLSPLRQAKLLAMVEGGSESLRKVAAWPVDTLYETAHGAIRGFVMPKVVGYEPIHHLYGPGHRKQQFPNADWSFLVNTARNVAAAFDIIHTHHHVIGDVNQNNIVVARNSIVKFIDCDSFQIITLTKHYLCEVGVGHFTPPELQGHSFHGIHRTRNHDNFGLAVLIFHLLLMGRHPYSGVYLGEGEMPVEKAIQESRFAFGSKALLKKMAPPPHSVLMDILPPAISWLFERAFAEESAVIKARPTAREWLSALEALKEQLRICSRVATHQYFDALRECPWCHIEQKSRLFFFNSPVSAVDFGPSKFDLTKAWDKISAVPSPGTPPPLNYSALRAQPTPLPRELNSPLAIFKTKKYQAERKRREEQLAKERSRFEASITKWRVEAGDDAFNKKFRELFYLRLEYERLIRDFEIERDQMQPYTLGKPFIRLLRIIFKRKTQQSSIKSQTKLSKLHPAPDENAHPRDADLAALARRFTQRRDQIEMMLISGAEELERIHEAAILARQTLHTPLQEAAQALAQAEADLRLMRK